MNLEAIIQSQRDYFYTGATRNVQFRKDSLEKLLESIIENESSIYTGLRLDLNKSEFETCMTEVSSVIGSIKYAIKHLDEWAHPKKVRSSLSVFPAKSVIVKEPFGVALIMAPWNYPFLLTMMPLIAAICGGNCAIVKTSRNSPNTSGVAVDLINSTFDRNYVYALEEVVPYDEILRQKYDYIFFTGSERVGKTVMRAAAENLTPVTLELGGKNPCIVDETANIEVAARKIMWAKVIGAGQTCVAPDYVLVHESVRDELISKLSFYAKQFIGDPFTNNDYPRIINLHHYMRLKTLIEKSNDVIGGRCDDNQMRIEPAIVPDVTYDDPLMKAEIFGPVLPVLVYSDWDDMLGHIVVRPKPLALYYFSSDKRRANFVMNNVSFGGGCINDCVIHLTNERLPFGGVGNSGMGKYHGKAGFDTFTHEKSMLINSTKIDIGLRYPPYDKNRIPFLKWVMK